jgi:prepilin-type processing-associated H-X9-DG protein
VCTGTGVAGGGSTNNTDGMFYAGSALTFNDIKDGTSRTAMVSESTLGDGQYGYSVARPDVVDVLTSYVALPFPQLGPLTDAGCATAPNINYTDLRGFQWAAGEIRSASYNHYYGPNSATPDCMGIDLDFSDLGWRTARSRHPGGVNLALADGSGRFIANDIDLKIWRALATINGGEVILDF